MNGMHQLSVFILIFTFNLSAFSQEDSLKEGLRAQNLKAYSPAAVRLQSECLDDKAQSCHDLGKFLIVKASPLESAPAFRYGCKLGKPESCYNNGFLASYGVDVANTVQNFAKACEGKFVMGCFKAASFEKDENKKTEYLKKACALGDQMGCEGKMRSSPPEENADPKKNNRTITNLFDWGKTADEWKFKTQFKKFAIFYYPTEPNVYKNSYLILIKSEKLKAKPKSGMSLRDTVQKGCLEHNSQERLSKDEQNALRKLDSKLFVGGEKIYDLVECDLLNMRE